VSVCSAVRRHWTDHATYLLQRRWRCGLLPSHRLNVCVHRSAVLVADWSVIKSELENERKAWLDVTINFKQESPANAKGTRDSSACMKAHCEQM